MRALFSLHDTERVEHFARQLRSLGWELVATRETAELLTRSGIACTLLDRFVDFSEPVGVPPTLHPRMEEALTGNNDARRIDLVYDIPYPREVGQDIGGRTLLALAVKGRRLPVMSPADMDTVIAALRSSDGVSEALRAELAQKALSEIAGFYLKLAGSGTEPDYGRLLGDRAYALANGENPYQEAELWRVGPQNDPLALANFTLCGHTPPCFTNLADFDNILQTLVLACEAFRAEYGRQPYVTIVSKHGNPCGMSVSWTDPHATLSAALFGDPVAVWGGELITNFEIDEPAARELIESARRQELLGSAPWMLDVVGSPGFSPAAQALLQQRKARKILANPALAVPRVSGSRRAYRWVRGGLLSQWPQSRILKLAEGVSAPQPFPKGSVDDLIVAWSVAFSSFQGGNEVALANQGRLIGLGGGPATVYAARTAVDRARNARHDLAGSTFCADAFFPYEDAPQALAEAGVGYGCVPSGGRHEQTVRHFFAARGIAMLYLPEDFRGFCRH